jgi:cell wall-associated NlpC family hydrolase
MTGLRRRKKGDYSGLPFAPAKPASVSGADRQMQVTGLSWWLASDGELRKYRPVPLLLGRKFEHGIMDCYTLFRDAYLCGIDLPDFERTNGWWLRERISIWQHAGQWLLSGIHAECTTR